jgi:hypothetical protein
MMRPVGGLVGVLALRNAAGLITPPWSTEVVPMSRSMLSKVVSVGRATVLVVGIATMVAALLGAASMAFAGNGDPWILGQLNSATAITRLAGSGGVDGPMLVVTNNDSGSDDTALDLNVQSGEPPMTVNSQTKVTNLNADRLDGMNSTAFASYERTVIVSPVGTNAQNGQALLNALSSINDASASKPYLIYIEPETYDLGNRTLQMKPYVDIQGSGELNTTITSTVSSDSGAAGTVEGADNTELRFLTVQSTSTPSVQDIRISILNDSGSPRLTHVSAETTGADNSFHIGVSNTGNSRPTMTDVTASASGNSDNVGVQISGGSTTMTDSTASASGSRNIDTALQIIGGSVTVRQSQLSATGTGQNTALAQDGGSAKVALSQLVGGTEGNNNGLQCFDNYDENLNPVNCRSAAGG